MSELILKRGLLWLIAITAVISVAQVPPIGQDINYHQFADTRAMFGIPNIWNVLSNLPFLFVGLYGLKQVYGKQSALGALYWGAITFCTGVSLVALGSGYYHWAPNNASLVWDRLPMTIGFMGFYTMMVSAFVKETSGPKLLPWLIVAGIVSVMYWITTESTGQGDLRWYALVQFLPMVLTLVILLFFRVAGVNTRKLVYVLLWYLCAKLLEMGDFPVFENIALISGHSLKHLAAAIASYQVIGWLKLRMQG